MDHLSAAGSSATRNLTTTEPSESLNRRKTVDFRFQRPYATSGSFFFNKPMRAMDSRRDFTSKKVFPGHFSELGEKANSALPLNNTSLPRRKARAKKTQQPKILGSRTKRSHTPPVATLRRRGPQIQNNAPQRNEDSKGTRLPNPKADRENCVGRSEGATEVPQATQAPARGDDSIRVPQ